VVRWRRRDVALASVILISAATVAGAVSFFGIPVAPCAGANQQVIQFTIIADLNGYNGSKAHDGQGPFFSVQTCEIVVLKLDNHDVQPHGIAVDSYAASGLEAAGGDRVSLRFQVYKAGSFRVFCNTVCSVHSYMQHAQLSVLCTPGSGCS
jgi:hypothetical protein